MTFLRIVVNFLATSSFHTIDETVVALFDVRVLTELECQMRSRIPQHTYTHISSQHTFKYTYMYIYYIFKCLLFLFLIISSYLLLSISLISVSEHSNNNTENLFHSPLFLTVFLALCFLLCAHAFVYVCVCVFVYVFMCLCVNLFVYMCVYLYSICVLPYVVCAC